MAAPGQAARLATFHPVEIRLLSHFICHSLFEGLPADKLNPVERVRDPLRDADLRAFDRVEAMADVPSMASHGDTNDPIASHR